MEESTKRYYTIAEVADMLSVNTSLIRFWETKFSQLRPTKNSKGDRRFTQDNLSLIRNIYDLVKVRGFTLERAKKELAGQKEKQAKMEEIKEIRAFLLHLKEQL